MSIEDTPLKTVDDFKYLGSTTSNDGSLDREINARICEACKGDGRLRALVLNQHNIQLATKLKVYRAVLLNSAEKTGVTGPFMHCIRCMKNLTFEKPVELLPNIRLAPSNVRYKLHIITPHEKPAVDHEHSLA